MLTAEASRRSYAGLERVMINNTVNSLFKLLDGKFRNFPNDYLVMDVETTGAKHGHDLITQLGYCMVIDGVAIDQGGFVLDWTQMKDRFPVEKLRVRLESTRQQVEWKNGKPTGKKYHMTIDMMRNEGIHPKEALQGFAELLEDTRSSRIFYVAHNGYHFDAKMLEDHFAAFTKTPFRFGDNEMIDTGMIEKGAQSNSIPWPGESIRDWSLRTYADRLKNVRWALDTHCVPRYGLATKHRLNMEEAHDAGFDCKVTHLLFEEYKAIARGEVPEPVKLSVAV